MNQENLFMLHSLVYGMFFSLLYDCIRTFRRIIPQGAFGIALSNFLFWMVCGGWIFHFLHQEGNGTLRWFAVLSAALGIWVYAKLLSRAFLRVSAAILHPFVRVTLRIKEQMTKYMAYFMGKLKILCKGVVEHVCTSFKRKGSDQERQSEQES